MPSTSCYLSCTGRSSCFYNTNISTVAWNYRYCCVYSSFDQVRYCCDDATQAITATASDNAPPECLPPLWTPWRLLSLGCGIFTMVILLTVFFHSFKKWRNWRMERARRHSATSGVSAESRRSSAECTPEISSISRLGRGLAPTTTSSSSSRTAVTDITTPPYWDLSMLPPCYDSLQELPVDYDKTAPPTYREVIELSIATAAADLARSQPSTSSMSGSTSGSSSCATYLATPTVSTRKGSLDSTTAASLRDVIVRDQPDIGVLNVDGVSIVGVVSCAAVESTEGVNVESSGTCPDNRQTSTVSEVGTSTTPPIVFNGEIVLSVSLSVRNPTQSQTQ